MFINDDFLEVINCFLSCCHEYYPSQFGWENLECRIRLTSRILFLLILVLDCHFRYVFLASFTPELETCQKNLDGDEGQFGSQDIEEERLQMVESYNLAIDCMWVITVKEGWKVNILYVIIVGVVLNLTLNMKLVNCPSSITYFDMTMLT